jgi:hypothetical protein
MGNIKKTKNKNEKMFCFCFLVSELVKLWNIKEDIYYSVFTKELISDPLNKYNYCLI